MNTVLLTKTNRLESLLSIGICPKITDISGDIYRVNDIGCGFVSLTASNGVDFHFRREEFDARLTDGRITVI